MSPALDSDNDGLTNLQEQQYGTQPNVADTDGDNLRDGDEVNLHNSSPTLADTENDRVQDDVEVANNSNPQLPDTDFDGLSDYDEIYNHNTQPDMADSDGDQIPDGVELALHDNPELGRLYLWLDPNNPLDAEQDKDNDGLTNRQEIMEFGTDPENPDHDNDGLTDGEEINRGLDPLDDDYDDDGLKDGEDDNAFESDLTAPTVELTRPEQGYQLLKGQQVRFEADAQDNGRVARVVFTIDGEERPAVTGQPYQLIYRVAADVTALDIQATAYDTNNNSASTSRSYLVIDDPRMTVQGQVLDKLSNPVNGVSITVGGVQVVTGSDGRYLAENVPATELSLIVEASTLFGNQQMLASSTAFTPVRSGVVDVETLVLKPDALELSVQDSARTAASYPYQLNGINGNNWSVYDRGTVSAKGYSNANGLRLYIDGNQFQARQFLVEAGSRETVLIGQSGNLDVTRKVFVSEDSDHARFTEILTNPTDQTVQVGIHWYSDYDQSYRRYWSTVVMNNQQIIAERDNGLSKNCCGKSVF